MHHLLVPLPKSINVLPLSQRRAGWIDLVQSRDGQTDGWPWPMTKLEVTCWAKSLQRSVTASIREIEPHCATLAHSLRSEMIGHSATGCSVTGLTKVNFPYAPPSFFITIKPSGIISDVVHESQTTKLSCVLDVCAISYTEGLGSDVAIAAALAL